MLREYLERLSMPRFDADLCQVSREHYITGKAAISFQLVGSRGLKIVFRPSESVTPHFSSCYADLFHGGITMSNADLLPSLLFKINQNQLALEAAIMELTLWVEQRGSAEVAGNVREALDTISKNEAFINMTLAVLMTTE
jgi:hypothetical protein